VDYAPWLQSAIAAHPGRFKVFMEMCGTREFRLVLCADVLDSVAESAVRTLECLIDVERKNGRLDCLACEPLVISEVRAPRDTRTGCAKHWAILASALWCKTTTLVYLGWVNRWRTSSEHHERPEKSVQRDARFNKKARWEPKIGHAPF
jgi:hypothetical protein